MEDGVLDIAVSSALATPSSSSSSSGGLGLFLRVFPFLFGRGGTWSFGLGFFPSRRRRRRRQPLLREEGQEPLSVQVTVCSVHPCDGRTTTPSVCECVLVWGERGMTSASLLEDMRIGKKKKKGWEGMNFSFTSSSNSFVLYYSINSLTTSWKVSIFSSSTLSSTCSGSVFSGSRVLPRLNAPLSSFFFFFFSSSSSTLINCFQPSWVIPCFR